MEDESIGVVSAPILAGSTCVRFGTFEAQTGSSEIEETNTQRVWKVWLVQDDKSAHKLAQGLSRITAMRLAQACADVWRVLGKPVVNEVGILLDYDGDGQPHVMINQETVKVITLKGAMWEQIAGPLWKR